MDKPRIVTLGERRFAGISVVTDNEHELSGRGKIAALWERYRQGRVQQQICNRTEENLTIALYSQYESDETGLYTYSIGSFVDSSEGQGGQLAGIVIPPATYAVFTSRKGPLAEVVVETWQAIWEWSKGGGRAFTADFEVYDERAADPSWSQVDIYIAIKERNTSPIG
ncbi:GyrI-like domain-containing protein [Brevibacillus massiliensis]|uniref:GyrI-like domain-containing protein n=1 Tax=Brevibacillus massiliensis TaxID=1118054 RepID=UPI000308CE55|nr:GyrI-like domain-containing protein [Brevibacillus massiliensis]